MAHGLIIFNGLSREGWSMSLSFLMDCLDKVGPWACYHFDPVNLGGETCPLWAVPFPRRGNHELYERGESGLIPNMDELIHCALLLTVNVM